MLYGETVSPTRLLFQHIKAFPKSDNLKASISPKMTDLTKFLDNNGKYAVYTGGDIHGIYWYIEMIVSPTTLTTSGQISHHLSPSSSIKNDAEHLQPVLAAIHMRQKSNCKLCGIIGHKDDACIIHGPNFLPPSLRRNMNQFNALHGE